MSGTKLSPVLIDIPTIIDIRGKLAVLEGGSVCPFDIKRIYYLYDIPSGSERGGHAHKYLQQILISIAGSFDVVLDNGFSKERVTLNRPNKGLLISSYTWREIDNFSAGSVCLVLASEHFSEDDYFRDYDDFKAAIFSK